MQSTIADRSVGNGRAFAATCAVLVVITVGVNMPPPLFPRYVDAYGLSAFEVTSIFATYTLAIAPTLLVFGPLSDAIGRRPVLIFALVAAAAGAVVLSTAQNEWWLYVGRALQGVAVGACQGPAAAALADTHPRGDVARAALVGTLTICVGSAVGPISAGVLAQYLPAPLHLSFLVELVLVMVVLVALLMNYPRTPPSGVPRVRISWPSVPAGIRLRYARATCTGVLSWIIPGLFVALAPTILHTTLRSDNSVVAGGVVGLMLVSSALAQLGTRRVGPQVLQVLGLALLVAGLGILVAAASAGSVLLCGLSAGIAGVGQGLAFSGSAQVIGTLAPSGRRGNVLSLFFVAIYVGVTVSVLGVGLLAVKIGLVPAVRVFSMAATAGCLASAAAHVRARARAC